MKRFSIPYLHHIDGTLGNLFPWTIFWLLHNKLCNRNMRRKVAYLHGNLPIRVFNVRLKISIKLRTGAVCSFNSLRILPQMLSRPQVLCVLILCRSFCTPGREIGSAVYKGVGFGAVVDVISWFHSEYRLTLFTEDVGFLLYVSCDLSIAPHWCDTCFVYT